MIPCTDVVCCNAPHLPLWWPPKQYEVAAMQTHLQSAQPAVQRPGAGSKAVNAGATAPNKLSGNPAGAPGMAAAARRRTGELAALAADKRAQQQRACRHLLLLLLFLLLLLLLHPVSEPWFRVLSTETTLSVF
jgi:hypothetical protein